MIDRITHFYDRVPEWKNGEQFTYPGVAWVLGKYRDTFTTAQRDHLKADVKNFDNLMGHGTENHAMMKCVAAYLLAQYWPDDTGWVRGTMTSAEVGETARERLLAVTKSLYDKSYEEDLSHNDAPVPLYPYYALYDCATDPEVEAAADAALHFHVANLAANHFEGMTIPPANRDYPNTTWNTYTYEPGKRHSSHLIHWFYWADAQNWTPAEIDRSDGNFVVYAALSGWRPPAAIESLARGETVPYELTASAPSFSHNDGHYKNLIQEALVRYPKSIDQKTEKDGWIFLREGGVYIAIRPLKPYKIDSNYNPAGDEFDVVASPGAKNAVIFDSWPARGRLARASAEVQQSVVDNLPSRTDRLADSTGRGGSDDALAWAKANRRRLS